MFRFTGSRQVEQAQIVASRMYTNRPYVVMLYSALGFLASSVIGILHIFAEENISLGYLELTISLIFVLNALGMKLTGNDKLASRFFLLILTVLFVVVLVTGGTQGTGILWIPLFPLAAYFLLHRREGTMWVGFLFVSFLILTIFGAAGVLHLFYNSVAMRQLLASLVVVSIGVYIYEGVHEAADRLAHKVDHAKSEFVTIASHQLRTPIAGIKWLSEILLSGEAEQLTKTQHEQVQQIYQSNERLARLVDAMLIVSSLELGTLPMRAEPLNLSEIAHEVVLSELDNSPKTFQLKERYDPDLPTVIYDEHILKMILQNLAANAIKYTPENGSISLEITRTPEKLFPASKGSVVIILSDSGYGIPEAAKSSIFTKFFRAENVKQRETDGTGLGLYIVKALLGYTGGRVTFDSHEGKGTTFIVVLPLEGTSARADKKVTEEVHA